MALKGPARRRRRVVQFTVSMHFRCSTRNVHGSTYKGDRVVSRNLAGNTRAGGGPVQAKATLNKRGTRPETTVRRKISALWRAQRASLLLQATSLLCPSCRPILYTTLSRTTKCTSPSRRARSRSKPSSRRMCSSPLVRNSLTSMRIERLRELLLRLQVEGLFRSKRLSNLSCRRHIVYRGFFPARVLVC